MTTWKAKKKNIEEEEDFAECLEKCQEQMTALMNANMDKLIIQTQQSED